MFQNFGQELTDSVANAVQQGTIAANAASLPKDGSIGTGTGGYTGSLGGMSGQMGYGNSLFGHSGMPPSSMLTPEQASGRISGKYKLSNRFLLISFYLLILLSQNTVTIVLRTTYPQSSWTLYYII